MKTVFSNSEVCHVFASRTQDNGRSSGGNIFFNRDTIYSYGHHFPMATFGSDGRTVYFTTRSYSNSTAKHLNYCRQALNHFSIIHCYNPESAKRGFHTENLENFNNEAKASVMKLRNARKPEIYLNEIAHQLSLFTKYCEHFNIKLTKKLQNSLPYLFVQSQDGGRVATDKEVKAREKARKEAEKQAKLRHAKELQEFRSFERQRLYSRNGVDYLRYNPETNEVQTSQGITISMEEAKRVYNVVMRAINNGGCTDCGKVDGRYQITSVTDKLLTVGCHSIPMNEVLTIGQELGF